MNRTTHLGKVFQFEGQEDGPVWWKVLPESVFEGNEEIGAGPDSPALVAVRNFQQSSPIRFEISHIERR